MQGANPIKSFTMSMDRGYHGGPRLGTGQLDPGSRCKASCRALLQCAVCRYRSMETLGREKGTELVNILREAEKSGFTSEDVQVAVNHCGETPPISWLTENWSNMIDTVMTLASNVGHEAEENTIGIASIFPML